jgi:integrase
LDETGAPMKVQQELMRHASIQTTMNVYGRAMLESKREANRKVVEMALRGAPLRREILPAIAIN